MSNPASAQTQHAHAAHPVGLNFSSIISLLGDPEKIADDAVAGDGHKLEAHVRRVVGLSSSAVIVLQQQRQRSQATRARGVYTRPQAREMGSSTQFLLLQLAVSVSVLLRAVSA
jgi:hypothetical protein